MTNNKIPSVKDREILVNIHTTSIHKTEVDLMAKLLNIFTQGFNLIGKYNYKDHEANLLWLLMLNRSVNSISCSIELMNRGYYIQSMTMNRMITEDCFICGNAKSNNQNVRGALLNAESIIIKGKQKRQFDYKGLAQAMDALELYETDYHFECSFAHGSNNCISALIDQLESSDTLKIAPIYNKSLFTLCCKMLFKYGVLMSTYLDKFLAEYSKEKEEEWQKLVDKNVKEIISWVRGENG